MNDTDILLEDMYDEYYELLAILRKQMEQEVRLLKGDGYSKNKKPSKVQNRLFQLKNSIAVVETIANTIVLIEQRRD